MKLKYVGEVILFALLIYGGILYNNGIEIRNDNAMICETHSDLKFEGLDKKLFYNLNDGVCCSFGLENNRIVKVCDGQ